MERVWTKQNAQPVCCTFKLQHLKPLTLETMSAEQADARSPPPKKNIHIQEKQKFEHKES